MDNEHRVMNYSQVVKALYPHFSIDTIARSIKVFAMFPEEIALFLTEKMPHILANLLSAKLLSS